MKAQNQLKTKQKNKSLVLKLLLTGSSLSRACLARETGLTKMTITNIVGELISDGFIRESGTSDTSVGRKPISLEIAEGARRIIGVYLSRNAVHAFSGDITGQIFTHLRSPLKNETNSSITEKIFGLLDKIIAETDFDKITGIGISSIGPVDVSGGRLLSPTNFFQIKNLPLAEMISGRYSLPVYIDNDMNTSALAEKYYGIGRQLSDFIYVGVSNGVGAGIISGHRLFSGAHGFAGEFGHVCVDAHGAPCPCGSRGCLELYSSFPADWERLSTEKRAERLDNMLNYLTPALIGLINLFDPQLIVLGHELVRCGSSAELLETRIKGRTLFSDSSEIPVVLSAFGERTPLHGALALVTDKALGNYSIFD